jgi:thiamine biosynthesis lipoprotein ApbE
VSAPRQITVIAPEAVQSDAWSKPLCVLGENGFKLLPGGVAGMILSDEGGYLRVVKTEGFPELSMTP